MHVVHVAIEARWIGPGNGGIRSLAVGRDERLFTHEPAFALFRTKEEAPIGIDRSQVADHFNESADGSVSSALCLDRQRVREGSNKRRKDKYCQPLQ